MGSIMGSMQKIMLPRMYLPTFSLLKFVREGFRLQPSVSFPKADICKKCTPFLQPKTPGSVTSLPKIRSGLQCSVPLRRHYCNISSQTPRSTTTSDKSERHQNGSPIYSSTFQTVTGSNTQKTLYSDIIGAFPDGIQMAFAYGSGAFQQGGNGKNKSENMLDFIFVVDKPQRWHRLNLERHPHHYSFLKRFGPRTITNIQERYGAGVYFNTLVPMHGRTIKYGVISTARLITDLLDWETLYISGRLHKPVSFVIIPKDENLITALKVNLKSAMHAALLLLPDIFTEEQFYSTIAGLSYAGDFRMYIAEDNNKVANIVKPNLPLFRRMYSPFLLEDEHVAWWPEEGQLEQALSFHSRHHHLKCLPSKVLYGLLLQKYQVGVFPDLEEIMMLHAYDSECDSHVANSIRDVVKKSSLTQALKGLATAGIINSIRYSSSKIIKKIKSLKQGISFRKKKVQSR